MLSVGYDAAEVEYRLTASWRKEGLYAWRAGEQRENIFSIDTPPPTVSGLLHMGHIFGYTQADFIARYKRMRGMNVFYPMGFDDNGLPTERLVEKIKQVRAGQMPRQEFINLCKDVVVEVEQEYRVVFSSIGLSVDWQQEYQTINPNSRKISQMSFLDLSQKGLCERRYSPTFWDPVDRTAIAQAEIIDQERNGQMYYINFSATDGSPLTIATTRPELIPACVAVFFHPDDGRYSGLSGRMAVTPIFGQTVPLLADSSVSQDKGTGLVMCCTFGDIQDIHWWRTHNLPTLTCITQEGIMCNAGPYDGMKVDAAKKQIIQDLDVLLIRTEDVNQFVKCAERSGAPLEIIPTHQWYIRVMDYKQELLEKSSECTWHPPYMKVRLDNWIEGLNQDWCISRQRYFGVPFPVWYSKRPGEEGRVLLADSSQLPVDPLVDLPHGYTADEVEPDGDVMDTWATSAVSPQLNSWSIAEDFSLQDNRHAQLFPFDLRPQGHDIIRTWAFYTIVKAMHHQQVIPWRHIMLNGWCLAKDKTKMSKSKGNVVTPQDLIRDKGGDVVRYWASSSKLGVDIVYSEDMFKLGKKLITKLWNAAKFCTGHISQIQGSISTPMLDHKSGMIHQGLDLWLLSKLQKTIEVAQRQFDAFEYCDARGSIEDFFWRDFCDNYLEMVKARIYSEMPQVQAARQSAIYTLAHALRTLLHLFAPIIPYITDELQRKIFVDSSVHKRGSWPLLQDHISDETSIAEGDAAVAILELVRKAKSAANLSMKAQPILIEYSGADFGPSIHADLLGVTNALVLRRVTELDPERVFTFTSECARFAAYVQFA